VKAKIEQINRYQVTIGDKTYDDFKRCEEWEGMIKFSGPSGTLIVDGNREEFTEVFSFLFGNKDTKEPVDLDIVKASLSLIPTEDT
jgi:hypothetical protein